MNQTEHKQVNLFRSRSFLMLWIATLASTLSMAMFNFLLSWYVVEGLGLEAVLGIVLISLSIPRIASMLFGGVLSDRFDQARIMFYSDLSRGMLAIVFAVLLFIVPIFPIWGLMFIAALFGTLGGVFEPSRDSILPTVVNQDQITRANSVIQGSMQVAMFSGPLIGGVMISFFTYTTGFIAVGICLLLGAISIKFIVKNKEASEARTHENMFKELKEGLQYAWDSSLIKALFIIALVVNFFMSGPLFMGLPIFVKNILQGEAIHFSMVEGGLTLGMIVGSILIGWLNLQKKRGLVAMIFMGVLGVLMFSFSQLPFLWLAIIVISLIGMCNPIINIPIIALLQEKVDQEKLGRVMALIKMAAFGLGPLSFATTSFLLSLGIEINTIMLWSSLPLMITVFILFTLFPTLAKTD